MSYTFSRRDFMKYTALTAVAIAGSGMLTGCSNPNRPVGKAGDTLKPGDGICEATVLNSAGKEPRYDPNTKTLTCYFKIVTKLKLLEITDSHFQVDVTTAEGTKHYYYNTNPKPSLGDTANPKASKDSVTEATLTLNLDLSGATKVAVLYTPKHAATGEPMIPTMISTALGISPMPSRIVSLPLDFILCLRPAPTRCGSFCVCGPFVSKFWAISCKMHKVF